jgi:CheY-like chemotaxis protein
LSFHDGEYAYGYLEFLSRDPRSGFPIPDYLFIEVDLPGKTNGYELLKRINDNLPFDHFKVVFVTEAPCDSHFLKSTKFPAVGYIHKPLTEDHVRNLKIHTNDETQNSK